MASNATTNNNSYADVDINIDDIDIDNGGGSPSPVLFRMQGSTFANINDQFGILDESGPIENPHNLYDFSFIHELNFNAYTNLTRLNFDISTLNFTNTGNFVEGNNPVAHDPDLLTYDNNNEVTNVGLNLSLGRYQETMIAISNGPDTGFVDGEAYNIAGVLAPASNHADPVEVSEFAAGAFYPNQVTQGNFGTGGDGELFAL